RRGLMHVLVTPSYTANAGSCTRFSIADAATTNYRIDVENPAPGMRPGQLHLQDSAGVKYLYDFESGQWTGLPRSIQRQIADHPAVACAIATGRRYLGLDP
ncbi:MAG TPA: hypothetical protein VL068_03600, partial [Microthrixaceae bacterium]|nr:hypothetical protein [Microthrixaceae bacterium]